MRRPRLSGNPNRNRLITYGILLAGFLIVFLSAVVTAMGGTSLEEGAMLPLGVRIGMAVLLGGIFFGWVTVRCPHCGHTLSIGGILPQDGCPHCGGRWE